LKSSLKINKKSEKNSKKNKSYQQILEKLWEIFFKKKKKEIKMIFMIPYFWKEKKKIKKAVPQTGRSSNF